MIALSDHVTVQVVNTIDPILQNECSDNVFTFLIILSSNKIL